VVDFLLHPGVAYRGDWHALPVVAADRVAGLHCAGLDPALAPDEDAVLRRRADLLPADLQYQHAGDVAEDGLDDLDLGWRFGVPVGRCQDRVADPELLHELVPVRRQQRRPFDEAVLLEQRRAVVSIRRQLRRAQPRAATLPLDSPQRPVARRHCLRLTADQRRSRATATQGRRCCADMEGQAKRRVVHPARRRAVAAAGDVVECLQQAVACGAALVEAEAAHLPVACPFQRVADCAVVRRPVAVALVRQCPLRRALHLPGRTIPHFV
jgi:hypothetical protein